MSEPAAEIAHELMVLEAELKRLEAEYSMFFAGRLARPPVETRGRVDAMMTRIDRMHVNNYGDRFRFSTLQSRYAKFVDLWERALRAREEGRPGPFAQPGQTTRSRPARPKERVLHVTAFSDPLREMDKLQNLYDTITEARREVGEDGIPFHRFAEVVKAQVATLQKKGNTEVAFRVAVKDGKIKLTARAKGDGKKG